MHIGEPLDGIGQGLLVDLGVWARMRSRMAR